MPTIEDRLRTTGEVWRAHVDTGDVRAPAHPRPPHAKPRRRVLLVTAAAGIAAAGVVVAGIAIHNAAGQAGNNGGVSASCAGPRLLLPGSRPTTRTVVRPGEELTVAGSYFLDGCNDTNPSLQPAPEPLTVRLSLHHGTQVVRLGSVHAHGELGTFRTTIRIPADFPAGPATLVSADTPSTRIELTVTAPGGATGTASHSASSAR